MTNKLVWEKKVWGKVLHIFHSEHAAVSYLVVNKGFQCSRHYHNNRVNQFSVISGRIAIEQWHEGRIVCESILEPGENCAVLDKIEHRFKVLESGQMVEVYWPSAIHKTVSLDDIVRIDEGGPIGDNK